MIDQYYSLVHYAGLSALTEMAEHGISMVRSLQYVTIVVGIVAVTCSMSLALVFWKSRKPIGKAVSVMLFCEGVGGLVTVAFATMSQGVFNQIGPESAMFMRWILFSTAIISSTHLAYHTFKLERE